MSAAVPTEPRVGSSHRPGPRLTFITDIPTPYTVAVLSALAELIPLEVVFCAEGGSRGQDWRFDAGIPFAYRIVGGAMAPRYDQSDIHLSPRILAALYRTRPQAIISGGFGVPTLYASLYARLRGVPLLVHSDGTSNSEAHIGRFQRLTRAYTVRAASGAIANSRPAGDRFAELGFSRSAIASAPHSTDLTPLLPVGESRDYGAPGALRLLVTGRLIPRKGIDRLLHALALARAEHPGVTLTIVGSGEEEGRLRDIADELRLEGVTFVGFVDQGGLPERYADADAYAFPTLEDPFGIVVLEAGAAGLPIIASPRAGATQDLLVDDESALIREPDDVLGLAEAIGRLADDVSLRERLGRAAHAAVIGRTPESTAVGYADAAVRAVKHR